MPFHPRPSRQRREVARRPVDPLEGVRFASPVATARAKTRGLTAAHFEGLTPSSNQGYTAADVLKAAKRKSVPRFGG